jgi:hypothetical protein
MAKDREERQTEKSIGWACLNLLNTEIGVDIQFFIRKESTNKSIIFSAQNDTAARLTACLNALSTGKSEVTYITLTG